MSFELIEQLVNEEVGRRTDEVLGLLFVKAKQQHIAEAHLRLCNCDYCKALGEYTQARINYAKVRRKMDDDFDPMEGVEYYKLQMKKATDYVEQKRNDKNLAKQQ